ncbi:hypothetical protein GGI35DRAFT_472889 [Trichoderma velutinum]
MAWMKRTSPQAQRVMREAFVELERVITDSDRAQLKNLSLEDVQQAALQIEEQLAASQSLRNMRRLAPLFTGLGHCSQAMEVLCSGTLYLPWLWAPIKLVLKTIKVYSSLAEPLTRFSLVHCSFSKNIKVQSTLAVYYSDILKFHGEAYTIVRRNAWQRLFATSWGRFQRRFDNILADLKAHGELVDKTQEIAKLEKEEEERTSTEFRAVLSVLKVDETPQINVSGNLTSEANQNPGSCSWILQQSKINSWTKCERDTEFVVLHGFVGSGKSVLAAQIATFLRALEHSLVAAHFCTYIYPNSTDYSCIIMSLMIQIIRSDPELITLSYDWLVLKKKAPTNAVVKQLLRLLSEVMSALPGKQKTIHIIIDGLDECDDNTIASDVKTLDQFVASASSSAATLLKEETPGTVSLSSEKDHLSKAIQDYTLQRINAIRSSLSQLGITDDDLTALASQITQKADGNLPRELGDYGWRLSQIMTIFDERSAQRISAVLNWIAFAKRPLRLAELLSALAFDAKEEPVDELVPPAYILDICEPLVQMQVDSSHAFVHVSIGNFLRGSDTALLVTGNESQRRHGLATVRCLLFGQRTFAHVYLDAERALRVLRGLHGFHLNATEFWVDYLLSSLEFDQTRFFESEIFELSCRLAEIIKGAKIGCAAADGCLYQMTIQNLLDYSNYPGISFQQLDQFKQDFRTSVFTCRLWSCPYAALGFNKIGSLTGHEAGHSKHICRIQGCRYPVFTSTKLLKDHVAECHTSCDQQLKRKSIRKRPHS